MSNLLYWICKFCKSKIYDDDVPYCPICQTERRSTCVCGGGWTFDFQKRRVYCKECEGEK